MEFKVGDRVGIKRECSGTILGEVYTLQMGNADGELKGELFASKGKMEPGGQGCSCQDDWIKIGRGRPKKEKPVKFVAIYLEKEVDPVKKFTSKKELTDWLFEAKDDDDINFDSIEVYPTGKKLEIEVKVSVKSGGG